MKTIPVALIAILLALSTQGCAQMFTAKTKATYQVSADGSKLISYESDKEQQGLSFDSSSDGSVKVSVDRALTPAEVVAATLAIQSELLKTLTEAIKSGQR